MKILIISGGVSSEREVSFHSAEEVEKTLKENGHVVELFDLKEGYKKLEGRVKNFDVIFPVIHGEEGEGGKLHLYLEKFKVPFIGGKSKSFKKGWYKIPFKQFCDKNKILTSPWELINNARDVKRFGFPCVLKASSGGSSLEVCILKSAGDLNKAETEKLLNSNQKLFVERYLPGTEITIGVLDNQVFPVLEIIPDKTGWFDFKNKYAAKTKRIPNAPSLNLKTRTLAQKTALEIHKTLDLGHYSRIDFIVSDNKIYVLEVNTIPGLTATSLFPKAALAAGLSFNQLLDKMVNLGLARFKEEQKLL